MSRHWFLSLFSIKHSCLRNNIEALWLIELLGFNAASSCFTVPDRLGMSESEISYDENMIAQNNDGVENHPGLSFLSCSEMCLVNAMCIGFQYTPAETACVIVKNIRSTEEGSVPGLIYYDITRHNIAEGGYNFMLRTKTTYILWSQKLVLFLFLHIESQNHQKENLFIFRFHLLDYLNAFSDKPADQISTMSAAEFGNDGLYSIRCMTRDAMRPYWRVDLELTYRVLYVTVSNDKTGMYAFIVTVFIKMKFLFCLVHY